MALCASNLTLFEKRLNACANCISCTHCRLSCRSRGAHRANCRRGRGCFRCTPRHAYLSQTRPSPRQSMLRASRDNVLALVEKPTLAQPALPPPTVPYVLAGTIRGPVQRPARSRNRQAAVKESVVLPGEDVLPHRIRSTLRGTRYRSLRPLPNRNTRIQFSHVL